MTAQDWENILIHEGLGVIKSESQFFEYEDWKHGGGQTLGEAYLPEKGDDDPVLVDARQEISDIADRLPPKWACLLQLRARGLPQRAIAARLEVQQPVISSQLKRIHKIIPKLIAARPVSRAEIEDWCLLTKMAWKCSWEDKRIPLIEEFLKVWSAEHAAWRVGLPQSHTRQALTLPWMRLPGHPVSDILQVIAEAKHVPGLRNRSGEGMRTRAEREVLPDYASFLR